MSTRVLVVDGEQSLAKVVASYLQRDGHEVACAFDGPTAVDAARRQPPDVVVLDPGLPGLDGIEVCRHLRTFSDFYRADPARDRGHGGSGIGLAIVRAIVAEHGGRVTAASDGPEAGASFTVTLPPASHRPS